MSFNYRKYHAVKTYYGGDEYRKKMMLSNWRKVGLKDNFEDVFLIYLPLC